MTLISLLRWERNPLAGASSRQKGAPVEFDVIHNEFMMEVESFDSVSEKEMEFINERAIYSFCRRESMIIDGSDESFFQKFSAFLYIFNSFVPRYECFSITKRFSINNLYPKNTILRIYAIVRPKHNPPTIIRHLVDQPPLELTDHNNDDS